jgi:hypothetical protein
MKNIICLMSLLFVLIAPLSAQNEGIKKLEDFSEKQKSMLEYSEDDMVNIPGMDISMAPPAHFKHDESLPGFLHKGTSASIQILEVQNIKMETVTKSLTQAYFEQQGFQLEKESVLLLDNGKKAKIYLTNYNVNDEDYQRIFFFTGGKNTIWINVNYPAVVKDLIYKPIISSLKTIKHN